MSKPISRNVIVLLFIMLVVLSVGGSGLSYILSTSQGYITGYQGAKASFAGIQYEGENYQEGLWDTTFSWDPDSVGNGKPAIAGEMTSVFVPSESLGDQPAVFSGTGSDIKDWLLADASIKNPVEVYEWELPIEDNKTAFYRMEEWKCKWYFSISCEPRNDEVSREGYIVRRNSLIDANVWFEFDLTPVWYFANQTDAYFAIATLRISEIALGGKFKGETYSEEKVNNHLRVDPMSRQSVMSIYSALFGTAKADKTAYSYNGKKLNPKLFTDKVYSYFRLVDFGVTSWYDFGDFWKGDVVTVGVDVHIFVIGEWKVQDIQEIPDEYGRTANTGGVGLGLSQLLKDFLSDPYGRLTLVAIGAVFVFLILAIFAPWVLIALMSIFRGKR